MAPRDQVRRISQHARLDRGKAQLLTRTGLDWTHKYRPMAAALSALPAKQAYLDGELCGVTRDGKTSFSLIQTASDSGNADALVFFLFDLLYLDGEVISAAPVTQRKERLRDLLSAIATPLAIHRKHGDLLGVHLHLFREAPSRSREASTGSSKDRACSKHSGRVGSTR